MVLIGFLDVMAESSECIKVADTLFKADTVLVLKVFKQFVFVAV
jgi:hypothetical protein